MHFKILKSINDIVLQNCGEPNKLGQNGLIYEVHF